jgi:hypothetical protein
MCQAKRIKRSWLQLGSFGTGRFEEIEKLVWGNFGSKKSARQDAQ